MPTLRGFAQQRHLHPIPSEVDKILTQQSPKFDEKALEKLKKTYRDCSITIKTENRLNLLWMPEILGYQENPRPGAVRRFTHSYPKKASKSPNECYDIQPIESRTPTKNQEESTFKMKPDCFIVEKNFFYEKTNKWEVLHIVCSPSGNACLMVSSVDQQINFL